MTRFGLTALLACSIATAMGAVCPVFDTLVGPGFDLAQHMGNWGIHGLVASEGTDPKLQCVHVDITADQFDSSPINLQAHLMYTSRDTGESFMDNLDGSISNVLRPYRWQANYQGSSYNVTILQSGMVDYSLMVMCTAVGDNIVTKALLAGRSHNQMPQSVVDSYLNYLQSQGLDTSLYFPIIHGHDICMH